MTDRDDAVPGTRDTDHVEIRALTAGDIGWVVRIDQQHSGRARPEYYRLKLAEAQHDTGIRVSLAAMIGGEPAGFLTGRTYYGDFGLPEPIAILDAIGVAPVHAGRKVGKALVHALCANLRALRIEKLRTEIAWDAWELGRFFAAVGFRPAPRLCLDLDLDHDVDHDVGRDVDLEGPVASRGTSSLSGHDHETRRDA